MEIKAKRKILLAPFPFGQLDAKKVRPVLCLSNSIGKYDELILAYITSNTVGNRTEYDILISEKDPDFVNSGLKKSSVIKMHKLFTLPGLLVIGEIGELPEKKTHEVERILKKLF